MLNRIRKHQKGEKQCETGMGEDTEDLHIFATNNQVKTHHFNMLHKVCSDIFQIEAQDLEKNPETGRLTKITTSHKSDNQTYLDKILSVGPKARVMLIKNIDVSDGLVNGVFGTVCKVTFDGNNKFPRTTYVHFDDPKIGKKKTEA